MPDFGGDKDENTSSRNGDAYEYAVAQALVYLLQQTGAGGGGKARIEGSSLARLETLRKSFESVPYPSDLRDRIVRAAQVSAVELLQKFKDLTGPVRLLDDSKGRQGEGGYGDICDIEIGRNGEQSYLGISCKLNNFELKHPRFGGKTAILQSFFGDGDLTLNDAEVAQVAKIFDAFKRKGGKEVKWSEFREEIRELAGIVRGAITRHFPDGEVRAHDEMVKSRTRNFLRFVLGDRDYVVVTGNTSTEDASVSFTYYNPGGSLGKYGIARTNLPTAIARIETVEDIRNDSAGIKNAEVDETQSADEAFNSFGILFDTGHRIILRLHNASTHISSSPSLKFSIRFGSFSGSGGDSDFRQTEEVGLSRETVNLFEEDFLPPTGEQVSMAVARKLLGTPLPPGDKSEVTDFLNKQLALAEGGVGKDAVSVAEREPGSLEFALGVAGYLRRKLEAGERSSRIPSEAMILALHYKNTGYERERAIRVAKIECEKAIEELAQFKGISPDLAKLWDEVRGIGAGDFFKALLLGAELSKEAAADWVPSPLVKAKKVGQFGPTAWFKYRKEELLAEAEKKEGDEKKKALRVASVTPRKMTEARGVLTKVFNGERLAENVNSPDFLAAQNRLKTSIRVMALIFPSISRGKDGRDLGLGERARMAGGGVVSAGGEMVVNGGAPSESKLIDICSHIRAGVDSGEREWGAWGWGMKMAQWTNSVIEMLPAEFRNSLGADQLKVAVHTAIGGCPQNGYLGYPFDGNEEEQRNWIDALPSARFLRSHTGVGKKQTSPSVFSDEGGRACLIGVVSHLSEVARREPGERGELIGVARSRSARDIATFLVRQSGKRLGELFQMVEKMAEFGETGRLAENARSEFDMDLNGCFDIANGEQVRRVQASMYYSASENDSHLVPTVALIFSEVGVQEGVGQGNGFEDFLRDEIRRKFHQNNGEEVRDSLWMGVTVALGLSGQGVVDRPYPFWAEEAERVAWRGDIERGSRRFFTFSWVDGGGATRGSYVAKEDVIRACEEIDQVWEKGCGPKNDTLVAHANYFRDADPRRVEPQPIPGISGIPPTRSETFSRVEGRGGEIP
jgi:hypothetical protein